MYKKAFNDICDNIAMPIICAFVITTLIATFTTLSTIVLIFVDLFSTVVIIALQTLMQAKKQHLLPLWLSITTVVILLFSFAVRFNLYIARHPIKNNYSQQEKAQVLEYYTNLSEQLYFSEKYQNAIPKTKEEVEQLVLKEFNNPAVEIIYIDKNIPYAGFVFQMNRNKIYINKITTDELYNTATVLTHELWHTKGVINEAETESQTCMTLINSTNKFLNFVGAKYAIYFLESKCNTYYDCSSLLIKNFFKGDNELWETFYGPCWSFWEL